MYSSQQVGQRRRKKRHSHGLKTVEINRGRNGYGFTISGQHPCVLSCIVGGSPADKIGLKMGDLLMAVNNRDVSQASHDDVVRLIGSSRGVLVLQIAEAFNSSESSDEEFQMRPKSKYPNRARMRNMGSKRSVDDDVLYGQDKGRQRNRKDPVEQARLRALSPGRELERRHQEKYARHQHHDMRAMGIENVDPGSGALRSMVNSKRVSSSDGIIRYRSPNTKHTIITREARLGLTKSHSQPGTLPPPGTSGRAPGFPGQNHWAPEPQSSLFEDDLEESSFMFGDYMRVIVGYMGTIGMAGDCRNGSSQLQLIQRSIQRLKVERKMTTMVLMELATNGVRLINNMGSTAAMYAMEHINYFDVDSADSRIFIITTVHVEHVDGGDGEISDSSCHVFKVSTELCSHNLHVHKVNNFGIHCTVHPETGQCMEFPPSAIPIVQYWHRLSRRRPGVPCETDAEPSSFSRDGCAVPHSGHNQSCLGAGQATKLAADNRVCVVDMSHNNSHNPESSFRWENDESGVNSRYNVYSSAEPDVSPILAEGGGRMTWLSSTCDGSVQVPDTLERLKVRARPNPVVVPQNSAVAGAPRSTQLSSGTANSSSTSELHEPASNHRSQSSHGSNSPSAVPPSQTRLKYGDSSYQQMSDVSAVSRASLSSTSETSSSSFSVTPVPMSGQSRQGTRPLPQPPFPAKPVPQPPVQNESNPPRTDCPPVPNRQPIVPRRLPKTPKNPPPARQKVPRPKSTPPFKELHRNLQEAEDVQSGYESEPGSVTDVADSKPSVPSGRLPQSTTSRAIPGTHRYSEGYPVNKKVVKLSEETGKKSGSFRHSADKPFRRQPLSSSHESLVISKDEVNGNNNSRLHAATSVTTITSKGLVITSQSNGNIETVGRAASWAVSFDKLLQDKVGIAIFTEFLKKEFSEENIIFWKACQEFKNISDPEERKHVAKQLFDKHLAVDASEPVNVDSSCRQEVKQMLDSAPPNTFTIAQLQITQLMKQDSYVRFLKSDSYKTCVMAEMEGKPLPCPQTSSGDTNNNRSSPAPPTPGERWRKTLKKSKSSTSATDEGCGEEKKRRSLLPWGKNKSDKKMAKMSTDPDLRRNSHEHGSTSKGRPSLELADLNTISKHIQGTLQEIDPKNVTAQESHKFCRVILPDSSTTVILASPGRTIHAALSELCERRQLILELLFVSLAGDEQPLDMSRDLSSLASRQIVLDKLCVFRLDLPQRRYICVRARPNQTVAAVFVPILAKYGLMMDQNTVVHVAGTGVILKEDQPISILEHKQVIVQSLDDFKEWGSYGSHRNLTSKPPVPRQRSDVYKQAKKLEELIGHLFRDVLDSLANNLDPSNIKFDENGIWDVTKYKTEENRSSGILGFIRRNSVGDRETNKAKVKTNKVSGLTHHNKPQGVTTAGTSALHAPAAVRGGGKRFDADDERLFELLSRAQSRQLDDQRGLTARDLELPDFLRIKDEKNPEQSASTASTSNPITSSTSSMSTSSSHGHSTCDPVQAVSKGIMTPRTAKFAMGNCSFSSDGVIPTPNHGTTYFMDGIRNIDESSLMDHSLCQLGMTSDLQLQDHSYMSFLSGSRKEDTSLGCQLPRVGQVSEARQPQVPKRRNPPHPSKTSEGSGSSQSRNSTPAVSDDDLDITLIPPSDSSGDEANPLPSPPHLDQSVVNHPEEANYSPPIPLNVTGKESSRSLPSNAADGQAVRCLSKHITYSKMVPSCSNPNAIFSFSGCDSDVEVELVGPAVGEHTSRSTPSPTTHDLVFDSGSECGSSLAPNSTLSLSSTCSSSSHLQSNTKQLLTNPKDTVQVSFV